MSRIKVQGNASGTGTLTLAAPNTNSDLTLNLPDTLGNVGTSAFATTDASGNLGLGVTPSAWQSIRRALQVGGNGALWGVSSGAGTMFLSNNTYYDGTSYKYLNSSGATYYAQATDGSHLWNIAPSGTAGNAISFTQAMTLDASGRLLVGTTTDPGFSAQVNIYNASNGGLTIANSTNTTVFSQNGNDFYIDVDRGGSAGNLIFRKSSSNTESARIDSSGNFMVGTTTSNPSTGSTSGASLNRAGYIFGSVSADAVCVLNRYSSTGDIQIFKYAGTQVGSISITGSTTAYNTSSDYRLKNITGPVTNSGAYIDSLKPVEGTWKSDGSTFVGLIAHEVQEASRTPVATGVKDGEQMQGMDYSSAEIIANLIAELQSVRKRLAAAGL